MHQYNMRFAADLRMHTHGEDESIIFSVSKVKLLHPQLLYYVGVNKALGTGTARDGLQWWPIIKMPICWDLDLHNC